jgi:hypothetical protein
MWRFGFEKTEKNLNKASWLGKETCREDTLILS